MSFYETRFQRRVEVVNEFLLLCLSYHFVLFVDQRFDSKKQVDFGTSAIVFINILLGLNTLIILGVSIKSIAQKIRIKLL